ncbi:MAG: DoxX-like family protein [Bryobacteraceae bacterium]|nr:DoxX-like family protein [Bryobacteraceae bacterium]
MSEVATGRSVDIQRTEELPRWKFWLAWICAVGLAVTFLVSGVWKLTDPQSAAVRMTQALVPKVLSMPAAIGFGIAEVFTGVLLLVPRFRRWGAWLAALMLVAFMVYIGIFYNTLRGEDCNCFPWIRRVVGPVFFITDFLMLLMAAAAGWWARPSRGMRPALAVLGAVCVFAAVSYGLATRTPKEGIVAPEMVMVAGKPFALHEGKVFLFFFNPECLHCAHAAKELAKLEWGQTRVVVVSTQLNPFAPDFLKETGLKADAIADEAETLRAVFRFVDVPYGVALENGVQRAAFTDMESPEAAAELRRLGFAR